eukprot:jgi/Mesvir1/8727/Mv26113-RA.1
MKVDTDKVCTWEFTPLAGYPTCFSIFDDKKKVGTISQAHANVLKSLQDVKGLTVLPAARASKIKKYYSFQEFFSSLECEDIEPEVRNAVVSLLSRHDLKYENV